VAYLTGCLANSTTFVLAESEKTGSPNVMADPTNAEVLGRLRGTGSPDTYTQVKRIGQNG
jgi:hypothetical protein